jgi:hypothetical protein
MLRFFRMTGTGGAAAIGAAAMLCFASTCLGAQDAAGQRLSQPSILEPGTRFAVADFDGDSKPDVATVLAGAGSSSDRLTTEYFVQLRFGSGARNSIGVIAPTGGLRLRARDVNGDAALDLVITTQWLDEPVAVLLNDGRGHFSKNDPSRFPATIFQDSAGTILSSPQSADELGVLLVRPPADGDVSDCQHLNAPEVSGMATRAYGVGLASVHTGSRSGRSPPLSAAF